jgi:hypothetical protein
MCVCVGGGGGGVWVLVLVLLGGHAQAHGTPTLPVQLVAVTATLPKAVDRLIAELYEVPARATKKRVGTCASAQIPHTVSLLPPSLSP